MIIIEIQKTHKVLRIDFLGTIAAEYGLKECIEF